MLMSSQFPSFANCRSPCGERGLKLSNALHLFVGFLGRSPCGERGLKYIAWGDEDAPERVAPRAGSVD